MGIFEPESLAIFAGNTQKYSQINYSMETGGYTFYCTAQRMPYGFWDSNQQEAS